MRVKYFYYFVFVFLPGFVGVTSHRKAHLYVKDLSKAGHYWRQLDDSTTCLSIDFVDNLLLVAVRNCVVTSSLLDFVFVSTKRIIGQEFERYCRVRISFVKIVSK
jgi:hypothetical protein